MQLHGIQFGFPSKKFQIFMAASTRSSGICAPLQWPVADRLCPRNGRGLNWDCLEKKLLVTAFLGGFSNNRVRTCEDPEAFKVGFYSLQNARGLNPVDRIHIEASL